MGVSFTSTSPRVRKCSGGSQRGRWWQQWWQLVVPLCCRLGRVTEARLHPLKILSTWGAFCVMAVLVMLVLPLCLLMYAGLWVRASMAERAARSQHNSSELKQHSSSELQQHSSSQLQHRLADSLTVTVLAVEGRLDQHTVALKFAELIDDKTYENWKKRLVDLDGQHYWEEDPHYNIKLHVTEAPPIFRQTNVTKRNIQEYVSVLCNRTVLDAHRPPWQIILINGVGPEAEDISWLILRAHPLLTSITAFPTLDLKTFIDPWQSFVNGTLDEKFIHPLFRAPSATVSLLKALRHYLNFLLRNVTRLLCTEVYAPMFNFVFPRFSAKEISPENKTQLFPRLILMLNKTIDCFERVWLFLNKLLNIYYCLYLLMISVPRKALRFFSFDLLKLLLIFLINSWKLTMNLSKYWKRLKVNPSANEKLIIDFAIEMYWMVRAVISLPRQLVELCYDISRSSTLHAWKGIRRSKSKSIAWSCGFVAATHADKCNFYGAKTSIMLTTVISTAIKLLKSCKIPLPNRVRCTIPILPLERSETDVPTSHPFSFNTEYSSSNQCYNELKESIKKIKRYPEKFIVLSWLHRCFKILPYTMSKFVTEKLSNQYPVTLSCIHGPKKQITLFDQAINGIYHFRQPRHNAVLSLSMTSYNGQLLLGGVGAEWLAPYTGNHRVLEASLQEVLGETSFKIMGTGRTPASGRRACQNLLGRPSTNSIQSSPSQSPVKDRATALFHQAVVAKLENQLPRSISVDSHRTMLCSEMETRTLNNSLRQQICRAKSLNSSSTGTPVPSDYNSHEDSGTVMRAKSFSSCSTISPRSTDYNNNDTGSCSFPKYRGVPFKYKQVSADTNMLRSSTLISI